MDPRLKYPIPDNVEAHSIEIKRSARWFHIGELPNNCSEIIIVLHGYGQHPSYMLNGLQTLIAPGRCICAPEGLSRFYIHGMKGRIGASWMTRDDREQEIKDYLAYLTYWFKSINIPKSTPVTLIGFSQGVCTAARWVANGAKINTLMFSSGTLPLEWSISTPNLSSSLKEIHIIRPKNDEFYTLNVFKEDLSTLKKMDFPIEIHEPEGTHTLNPKLLCEILN